MAHEKLRPEYVFDEEKIAQLKQLAPECFEDGKINFTTLSQNLGDWRQDEEDPELEHFGLFWPGKRDARKAAAIPPEGTLEPLWGDGLKADGTPDTDGVNDSKNIFIEGENLEVLKLLQKSYAGKIKMIYIDPPYNTGNDFVYDDDFTEPLQEYLRRTGQVDEEGKTMTTNKRSDGRFHSKWLSMMYPRLRLARNLLKNDGLIIIHIDENEVNNLTVLLNEVFGEENNLGTVVWDKKNPKGDSKGIAYQHETILCFIKNIESLSEKESIQRPKKNAEKIIVKANELYEKIGKTELPDEIKEVIKKFNIKSDVFENFKIKFDLDIINKEFSTWIKKQDFSGGESAYSKIDKNGDVYRGVSMAWPNKKQAPDEYFIPLVHPITGKKCPIPERGWRNPVKTMQSLINKDLIIFGEDEKKQPERKYLLKENLLENIPSVISNASSDDSLFSKWGIPFDNPKPYKLAFDLINYFTNENDFILDFFAGSGTTGHAVNELNSLGSKRKYILIQIDELVDDKSLAKKNGFNKVSDITIKRLKKSASSYSQNSFDKGLKFCKLKSSNYKPWKNYSGTSVSELELTFDEFNQSPLREGYTEDGLLTEIILLEGFTLCSTISQLSGVQSNSIRKVTSEYCDHALLVCLDNQIVKATVSGLQLGENDIFICLDSAISTEDKLRLSDKGLIKTI